jgi:hypothetical protein
MNSLLHTLIDHRRRCRRCRRRPIFNMAATRLLPALRVIVRRDTTSPESQGTPPLARWWWWTLTQRTCEYLPGP